MSKDKKIIVVLGTTASGKTKLAVRLASAFDGEIISADSRQVYTGMDIGTGKDLAEYGKIRHHLIDVVSPKKQFSVADFQKRAYKAIDDIIKRGKVPIICGGTGLYIDAVVKGYTLGGRGKGLGVRERLNKKSLKQLLALLKRIDIETYHAIDKKNHRRVQRALEIYYETGTRKSKKQKIKKTNYEFLQLGVTFPKEQLFKRIQSRLDHRFKEGMVQEVKKLHKQGVSWKRMEDFGLEYRLVARFLRGIISKQDMEQQLFLEIKKFAKRQMTWFKRNKKIIWIQNYSDASKKVRKFLS